MAWRASNGRECCNDCRRVPDLGAPVWRGEFTPAIWCEPCANVFGQTLDDDGPLKSLTAMAGLDKRAIAKAFPQFTEAMRAFKQRAAMNVTSRDVSARIVGERE